MVMMKYFPTDLINDILLRSPFKSLTRFKSVSKPWCSSIDNPCFVTCHLKHSTETSRGWELIFRRKKDYRMYAADVDSLISKPGRGKLNGAVELIGLPKQKNGDADSLIGTFIGLICLYHSPNIILWNKLTGEYHVTNTDAKLSDYILYGYGFGYDSINDDYKAIIVVCSRRAGLVVYSLRNDTLYYKGKWKSNEGTAIPWFLEHGTQDDRKGVLVGGAMHWLASWENNSANNRFDAITSTKSSQID